MEPYPAPGPAGWLLAAGGLASVALLPVSLLPGSVILTIAPIRGALAGHRARAALVGLLIVAAFGLRLGTQTICQPCVDGHCTTLTDW